MVAVIRVGLRADRRLLDVTRDSDVSEPFWLRVRAEWGADGADPGRAIIVPVDRALSRLAWLGEACRLYRVGVAWDPEARVLIERFGAEQQALAAIRLRGHVSTAAGVDSRLQGTRFTRALHDFQKRDLARLLALPHAANFSVPGAGKTAVTYALYEAERAAGRVERLVVIAPLSAFDAWQVEAGECLRPVPTVRTFEDADVDSAEIILVNYQRVSPNYETVAAWVSARRTHLVLDEAHRIKAGRQGQWGTACLDLAFLAARRDVLTGTPAPHAIADLEALVNFLWPNQGRRVLPAESLLSRPSLDAVLSASKNLQPLFVRTTKRELQLPKTHFDVRELPLEGLQAAIYGALVGRYVDELDLRRPELADMAQMGRITMYLLEAATNPGLLAVGSSPHDPLELVHPPLIVRTGSRLADLLVEYGRFETPRKFAALATLVRDNVDRGQKTLVWSNFVRNLTTLERLLAKYQPALIHGGIPSGLAARSAPRRREEELRRFREDPSCTVLLANPAALAEGISLHHACHHAVYIDRTFNAGHYLQSLDRIHRLGLSPEQETRFTLFVTLGTIDMSVDQRVRKKVEQLGHVLDDKDLTLLALPGDDDYGPAVESPDDIAVLFDHLREAAVNR